METGELWKHGIRVKLQIKPLQVLQALLEKPGEMVTREELCKRLWRTGTFVDFESGLNTATNRLRSALGDSAEAPRYIETLPRLGYRFICPVTEILQAERAQPWSVVARQSGIASNISSMPTLKDLTPCAQPDKSSNKARRVYQAGSATLLALAAVFGAAYFESKASAARPQPTFRQLTFRTGAIRAARFIPGSEQVVYTAKWQGSDPQTSVVGTDGSNSRSIDFAQGVLASISRQSELALIARDPSRTDGETRLSRSPLSGDGIRVVSESAPAADWFPDGRELATVQEHGTESLVEFPSGHNVYSSHGWISCLRVSPQGDRVAFLEHPVRDDDAGYVRIVDKKGNSVALTGEWNSADGLAWSPSGNEVWFTASKAGTRRILYAVSRDGKLRLVSNGPSSLRLLDISSAGRVLLAVDDARMLLRGALAGDGVESDFTKFDLSHVDDISRNGKRVLFTEGGEAGGQHYTAYVHDAESHSTFRVASGRGLALSPDGNWALTVDPRDRGTLSLTSVATGVSQKIDGYGFEYQWAKFLSGGDRLILGGAYPEGPLTICTQNIHGGRPAPLDGSPYLDYVQVSPDGSKIAGMASNQLLVFDIAKKSVHRMPLGFMAFPVGWSRDGGDLFVLTPKDSKYRIVKTDALTGSSEPWKTLTPSGTAGFEGLAAAVAAPDAGAYAYSSNLDLSRLYVVDGWS